MNLVLNGKNHAVTINFPSANIRKVFLKLQKENTQKMAELREGFEKLKDVPSGEALTEYLAKNPELIEEVFAYQDKIYEANDKLHIQMIKAIVKTVPEAIKAEYEQDYDSEFWQSQDMSEIAQTIISFRKLAGF